MLYVDTPTLDEFRALNEERDDPCVSIYLPTTPLTQEVEGARIAFGNQVRDACEQLAARGFDKRRLAALEEHLGDLAEDDAFWERQAKSLAVLATTDKVRTFRLANTVQPLVQVADRYHLKPLMRAITFPNHAFVLALSENAVRLVEVFADLPPARVPVPHLPKDAASALSRATLNDRSPKKRLTGTEGQKTRLTQYARLVDASIRPILSGRNLPLIVAATEPLATLFRSVCSYPGLLPDTITSTNDRSSEQDLAEAARPVLDRSYAAQVSALKSLFERRFSEGRATTDLSDAARAATFGAVEVLLVDMNEVVPGHVDEQSGAITFTDKGSADSYGIVDEIMGRALAGGAHVLSVRKADLPGGKSLAAILRYAV